MAELSITLTDVQEAAKVIKHVVHRTPILTNQFLNKASGKELYFKCENFQKTGAFKIRGATNAVHNSAKRFEGTGIKPVFVTHSSGNHAQALSLAANTYNLKARIVMPSNSPEVKKDAVRGYGGEVFECEPSAEARESTAKRLIDELGNAGVFISSCSNPEVIAGQGTMALEILKDIPDLDAFIVPTSGGGMLSGICVAAKELKPDIKIFSVEPEDADDLRKSFAAKRRIPNETFSDTIADGLKMSVSEETWPIIRDNITGVIVVSDEEIVAAMKMVMERMKLVIEPSAAVGLAAVLKDDFKTKYSMVKKVCVILSGGNMDLQKSASWFRK